MPKADSIVADIALGGSGGIRVPTVGDNLDRGLTLGRKVFLEIPIDDDDKHGPLVIDEGGGLPGLVKRRDARKDPRAVEPSDKRLRGDAAILIHKGIRHGVEVIRGGVTEDQALENRSAGSG